jgi:hypothetical protein
MTSSQGSQGLASRGIEDSLNFSLLGLPGRGMEVCLGPLVLLRIRGTLSPVDRGPRSY